MQNTFHSHSSLHSRSSVNNFSLVSKFRSTALFSVTVLVAFILVSGSSHAAVLFADDFIRSNSDSAGIGWSEIEADSNDIAIYNDRLRLRDYLTSGFTEASFEIDTSGFEDIALTIDWQVLSSTEASDTLNFGYSGQHGNALWSTGLGTGGLYSSSILLDALADSGPQTLSFWFDANSHTESVYINRLSITGSVIPAPGIDPGLGHNPPAVSEPTAFTLLNLGLLGLMATRKRSAC